MKQTAVIALGSNLQNPEEQIHNALAALGAHPKVWIRKTSSLYRTAPVGYTDQPDFINAVCIIETELAAADLLATLNRIEAEAGRERAFRNAPRTLDLDIIDYAGIQSDDPRLTLPHPRASERGFVMWPLAEIAPEFALPGMAESAGQIAERLGSEGLIKI
ncbi:MAG: 2-amino-4-hydroxy-6-hydroxymethyldihydropteridine diphosphokinase [Neisseria sp.]|uniref:2-amino-4-hydroxy-6- hydroxymethyldihydropteridine diphosphokinase n=1 Tax=Neisseria sp. TaxID=192066 RepID=UPI0026DB7BEB|nr:2-amino-4-hydroxy-6-hydroxymethyldihydropteridine diphosphokinase [Neisseria sp.]MDO4641194.1 2-amino-4-hydroxy-6-hydroxymethyldihydropteridine diphosphokinase [Neisseria sp.]